MSETKRTSIGASFLYNAAYQLLALLLPLATIPYLARVLGPEPSGVYAYTYSIAYYFTLVILLGVPNDGSRCIARLRDNPEGLNRAFCSIWAFQAVRGVVAMLAYMLFSYWHTREYRDVALIQTLCLVGSMLDISWLFFGLEQFRAVVIRNAAVKLAGLLLIFLCVREAGDLWKYTLIMAGSAAVSQGCLWFRVKKHVRRVRISWRDIKPHIRPELTLFLPVIAVSLYKTMDKIMLGAMSSMAETGYYQHAEKIVSVPLGLITALGTVMLPRMSGLAAAGELDRSMRYIERSLLFVMFMGSAFAFGLAGIAPVLTPVFLGPAYLPCVELIVIAAASIVFFSWANVVRTQYLIPHQMDTSYTVSVALGAVCNLTVNAALIPGLGSVGAAIGTVLAEAVVCISQTVMVRKRLPVGKYLLNGAPFLLIGGVMFAVVRAWLRSAPADISTLVCGIGLGASVYLILSFGYIRLFQKEIYELVRSRLGKWLHR